MCDMYVSYVLVYKWLINAVWRIAHCHNLVINNERFVVEERCDKRGFEHERNTMKWIECCVSLCLCSLWMCTCIVHEKDTSNEWYRVDGDTAGESRERKVFGKEKRRKEGKRGLRKERLFAFLWLCFSHHPFPFQSTMPSLFFPTLYTALSHTQHTT